MFIFIGCTGHKNSYNTIIKEDTLLLKEFCNQVYNTVDQNDSIIELKNIFINEEYDNFYLFSSYTTINKINDLIGFIDGLPYSTEVNGNEDLIVLSSKGVPKTFFIIKNNNIIVSDLARNKYEINSSLLILRKFQRDGKEVIYICDK